MRPPRKTTAPASKERKNQDHHHNNEHDTETTFTPTTDICQQLLDRYNKSSAPQHRHLIATAAATRSLLLSSSLPLTPLSYFAASVATLADSDLTLDADALSALTAFLAIVLPLLPENAIVASKAAEAVVVLVGVAEGRSDAVSNASARAVVKCLGVLLGFCNLEEWNSVKLGFETLLKFSIDRRPKVRKCAQDCVVQVFKSLKLHAVTSEAGKLVLSLFKGCMPFAVEISASGDTDSSKDEILSKPEHLDVVHMLTLLKHILPYLSVKVSLKITSQLHKVMNSHFSALTRHIFGVIKAVFETSKGEVVILVAENIMKSLESYISLGEKNPTDTVLYAATLLRSALDKLQAGEASKWIHNLPLIFGSIAGLLTSEASTAAQASDILKELINSHISGNLLTIDNKSVDDEVLRTMAANAIKSVCVIFENELSSCGGIPNEHILSVMSVLFHKLGEISYLYMKGTILKLGDMMKLACQSKFDTKHLQECIGSAVIAIGPEKILTLVPINPNAEDLTCSNVWLIPLLRDYVVGSSLQFFIEHIVPLAESFQQVSAKVFWRHYFIVISFAKAFIELVNQNRSVLGSSVSAGEFAAPPKMSEIEFGSKSYSKKKASRNIKVLVSCSEELLQALVDVFFGSTPEQRAYLKDTIACLASITDSSVTKRIFISLLEKYQLINDLDESGKQVIRTDDLRVQQQGNFTYSEKEAKRGLTVELASSLVEGASEDLISSILSLIKHTLQESNEDCQSEAYNTLSRMLEEHSWFRSSHVNELMDFLLGLKPPINITMLRSRFACFRILLVDTLQGSLDEENSKAFLVLNEVIITIKDSTEEARKAAYDMLIGINSALQESPFATSDGPYQKLVSMIMGYLSGSSPHITSGAVSALSILVHNNAEICLLVPDLVPSVLALLQTKAVEVIKAVLGFVKVLVLCHQAKDLQNILPDIVNEVVRWSSVSRHHFRAKACLILVTVILEILMRRCGSAQVKLVTPEKHLNFVKGILENRHGKASSKESSATDMEPEVLESSPRRMQLKRKREEPSIPSEEDGKVNSRFRKQGMKLVKKAGSHTADRRTEVSAVRLMRTELGGALADPLNENGKGSGDNEMGYVERTLGFRTWILDDRDLRLNSKGFNEYTRICIPIVGSRLKSLCHINLDEIPSSLPELRRGYVILMRSCGSAPVKLVTPEKHRNFVKGVLEVNCPFCFRFSRIRYRIQRKRKCEEPSIPSEEDGTVESRFRESGMKLVKMAGIRTADRRTKGQPRGNARNKRNFNGHPTTSGNT
ncbi:hypothetical protein RHMOL_Rhmol03G0023000 [Rhododendron molle]|uniref:Uncharacterized protein n=1 Tax=Rhododendron molle TaxID=49168 RepID=A0ACC0PC41_RHOML|nr:hypothetical protein RHMOL_Rhmol03G0023000 [Rhododendron molle]